MSLSWLAEASTVLGLHDVFIWLTQRPLAWPRLAEPLWLCLLLLPLGLWLWRLRARNKLLHYADEALQPWAMIYSTQKSQKRMNRWLTQTFWPPYRAILWISFWLFLSLTLADPQVPKLGEDMSATLPPVLFLVDDSAAMSVADVSPNRQSRAQTLAGLLAQKLSGHRLGLMVYSDEPGFLLPPASDPNLFDFYLQQLPDLKHPLVVPRSDRAFDWIARMPQMRGGVVVWLTSGDAPSFEGAVGSRQLAAAEMLRKADVTLVALTVAGRGGPMRKDGMPIKDDQDQIMMSVPAPKRVAELARLAGGAAAQTSTVPNDVAFVVRAVAALPNLPPQKGSVTSQRSLHALPLVLALFCGLALIGLMLRGQSSRKSSGTASWPDRAEQSAPGTHSGTRTPPATLGLVLVLLVLGGGLITLPDSAHAAAVQENVQENVQGNGQAETWLSQQENDTRILDGNRALIQGAFAEAQVNFAAAKGYRARLGEGVAAFRRADYAFAVDQWQMAVWLANTPAQAAVATFNLGDALTMSGRYAAARDAFAHVLSITPQGETVDGTVDATVAAAARTNLAILQQILQSATRNAKDSPRFQGFQSATYGYYHEPKKSRMDKTIQKSQGVIQGSAGTANGADEQKAPAPFVLSESTASSARAKLNLIHNKPAPLLDGLLRQQPYHFPVIPGVIQDVNKRVNPDVNKGAAPASGSAQRGVTP